MIIRGDGAVRWIVVAPPMVLITMTLAVMCLATILSVGGTRDAAKWQSERLRRLIQDLAAPPGSEP